HTGVVFSDRAARGHLLALVIASEVRTDDLPAHAFVRRFKQNLRGEIQNFGIVGREDNRFGPLEAILLISGGSAVGVDGPRRYVFFLLGAVGVAGDFAAIGTGVHDFRIARIRRQITALTAASWIPTGAINAARRGAGDGH